MTRTPGPAEAEPESRPRDGSGPALAPGPRADDPLCPLCMTPLRSGVVFLAHGRVFHVACHAGFRALERRDGGRRTAREGDAGTAPADGGDLPASTSPWGARTIRACPLCGLAATVTDWRPGVDWVVVEGCACGGFFVSAPLFEGRLATLSEADRRALALRIRWFRAKGREAWCVTTDGSGTGPLDIREGAPPLS